ncbi:MAG: Alpha-L-Rha alpha-1,3-L-rhamnosyltransferase [Cytophagales bacterium]|jgi:glycosyltransferase involved in cell wall biosynthesis|nr:MAG: Alpha-L-Rha alpha-1,3-L-rhamnosyltransferase [Cytophagales bacterium]
MAVHNGEKYLHQQLDSILPQLNKRDELIVSDDFSTDNSLAIIRSYHDNRIKILPPNKYNHPAKNFEYALNYCNQEIIFLADQDDVWHKNKLTVMKEELTICDLAVCDCRIVDENLLQVHPSFFDLNHSRAGLLTNFIKSSFMGCCMAFRRDVLAHAFPFPQNAQMHDQWIGLVAERYYKVHFIPIVLVDHRRHSHNYSSTSAKSNFSFYDKISMRFHLAKNLLLKQ